LSFFVFNVHFQSLAYDLWFLKLLFTTSKKFTFITLDGQWTYSVLRHPCILLKRYRCKWCCGQGRPKAPLATQNASRKSLGTKFRKLGGQIYRFVSRENKCIKL